MKLMMASDIHGSDFYLDKLLKCYESEHPDKLVLLGDLLYHGPRNDLPCGYAPKSVIAKLNLLRDKILCVRGNCDTEVDQMVLDFPVLADYAVIFTGEACIYATHGHVYNEQNLPPISKGDIILHGHTHVPVCNVHDDYVCMNPGSVSIPKENSPHGYMIFENGLFSWKDLDGNLYKTYKCN